MKANACRRGRVQNQYMSDFKMGRIMALRFVMPWHFSSYKVWCYDNNAFMEPVDRTGSYAKTSWDCITWCEHRPEWPSSCSHGRDEPYSFVHSVESTLEYCNGCWTVCVKGSSSSFGAGIVATIPLHRFPLSRNLHCLRLQWSRESRHWTAKRQYVFFRILFQLALPLQ